MEFSFNVAALFDADNDGMAVLSGKDLQKFPQKELDSAFLVIDEIGQASAKVI